MIKTNNIIKCKNCKKDFHANYSGQEICGNCVKEGELTEGAKFDTGKTRYDLIDPYALDILAQVYTYGTIKYQDHNWRKGFKWSRVFGALMRHAWAYWKGEDLDKESGLPHLGHAAWCCFTLLNFTKFNIGEDDRIKKDF